MKNNEQKNNNNKELNFLSWEEAKEKAKIFLKNFTLKEKIRLMYGSAMNPLKRCVGQIDPIKSGWFKPEKFAGIKFDDGPTGPRFQNGLTNSWPTPINLAATFNRELVYAVGKAQGYDFYHTGINVALTPCINILRVPTAGRIFEGYGENPFLTGELSSELIKGIQSNGVIACAKHFIGNEQEKYRCASNSIIDERTLMEIYVEPFYKTIKKGDVGCIMCSYNALNGTYLYRNKAMKEILKEKFGFKGFIISDWFAVYSDTPDSINNGLDVNMPGTISKIPIVGDIFFSSSFWAKIPDYIEQKLITEEKINETCERIISTMYKLGQMDYFPKEEFHSQNFITENSKKLNRRAAAESNILLKNEDNILPINLKKIEEEKKKIKLALLGIDAIKGKYYGQEGNFLDVLIPIKSVDGHIVNGYGSAATTLKYIVDPYEGIKDKIKNMKNIELIQYAKLDKEDNEDIENSVKFAEKSDIVLIFVQSISGEGFLKLENTFGDRKDLELLHNGKQLIEKVSEVNKNVIVVINAPGPINMDWRDKVKGIIFSGLAGPESGNGIADVLFGDVNPSGHLPFVIGKREQYPADIKEIQKSDCLATSITSSKELEFKDTVKYDEKLFVGQYWFDKKNEIPIYYFGYGLSYTKFEFSDLTCNFDKKLKKLEAKFKIKNIGHYDGSVVALLYLTFPLEVEDFPIRVLKGFDKYFLKTEEMKEFCIIIEEHDLSYYDTNSKEYKLPSKGSYTVFVGQSSDIKDLTLSQKIDFE